MTNIKELEELKTIGAYQSDDRTKRLVGVVNESEFKKLTDKVNEIISFLPKTEKNMNNKKEISTEKILKNLIKELKYAEKYYLKNRNNKDWRMVKHWQGYFYGIRFAFMEVCKNSNPKNKEIEKLIKKNSTLLRDLSSKYKL